MFSNQKLWIFLFVLQAAYVSRGIHGQQQMQMSYVTDEDMVYVTSDSSSKLDWNYTKNGTDWNVTYEYCSSHHSLAQSPATVNISNEKNIVWSEQGFSFVPYYQPTTISSVTTDNLVFTINLTKPASGKFFGFTAVEPAIKYLHYLKWQTASIQFHYPAEHPWSMTKDGKNHSVTADLEMQIYGMDLSGSVTACKNSNTSALSLFFFLSDKGSDETDKFFEFQSKNQTELVGSDIDLSVLVNSSISLYWPIYGYVGGLTQPPCTKNVCWYLVQRSLPITQKQLDYFKIPGLDGNARQADQGHLSKDWANLSIFGKNDEIIDPNA